MITEKEIQEQIEMAKIYGYYDDLRFKNALKRMKRELKQSTKTPRINPF